MWKLILSITVVLLGLLFGASHPTNQDRCEYGYYRNNGGCNACPSNCKDCESDTNCTMCTKGYYGQVCEKTCDKTCNETCHKEFGFCLYGCSDGTYSSKEDRTCRPCPDDCSVCSSSTKCHKKRLQQCPECPDCDKSILDSFGMSSLIIIAILVPLIWRCKGQDHSLNIRLETGTPI